VTLSCSREIIVCNSTKLMLVKIVKLSELNFDEIELTIVGNC